MRIFTYLFLLGITISISAQQKGKQTLAQLEESPAGSKIIWFFDAVKSGGISAESIEKHFSPKLVEKMGSDKLMSAFDNIKMNDGTLIMYQADRKKITEYKLIVKGTKSNEWMEMNFYFEDNPPYRIAGFTIDTIEGSFDSFEPMYPKSN
ncbi:Cpe/LpqF family protein [Ekhidna sp.]|uniref:Cpe/LpqF family protein n=1 Tax=Ekhidna sp. TaxID=2608089 RepID=UPI003298623E